MRDERRPGRRFLRAGTAAVLAVGLVVTVSGCRGPGVTDPPGDPFARGGSTARCVYTANRVADVQTFADAIGAPVDCVMVFNNAAPTWADLERPWFTIHSSGAFNWADWKNGAPSRRLVITQSLIPSDPAVLGSDWRAAGAAGAYDDAATRLAEHLVENGLGDSVIRLAHEANGTWTKDNIGDTPQQWHDWAVYWGRFVTAMRAVPGAHFLFDWTVNSAIRPIDPAAYYPGDDVVDIVGIDLYDFWDVPIYGPAPADPVERWQRRMREPSGMATMIHFATDHGKPLSIPEWGLSAVGRKGGIGDNPTFVRGIAGVVSLTDVTYQAYFESTTDVEMLLTDAPQSLAAYRRLFVGAPGGNP